MFTVIALISACEKYNGDAVFEHGAPGVGAREGVSVSALSARCAQACVAESRANCQFKRPLFQFQGGRKVSTPAKGDGCVFRGRLSCGERDL